jgi:hypothetical protein
VALSADGRTLVAGYNSPKSNSSSGVVLWDIGVMPWRGLAAQLANRNLTFAEWQQYFPDRPQYRRTFADLPDPDDLPKADAKE